MTTITNLKGVTTTMVDDARRAAGWHGSVNFHDLPGRSHDERSNYYWELDYEGVIDGSTGETVELYQCEHCTRWFQPGDIVCTESGPELCIGSNSNKCYEAFVSRLWSPPEGEPVAVEPTTYRVSVLMSEYRYVWVIADNPAEAKRLVEEEDWFGPEFPCESQTCDVEFERVTQVGALR